MKDRWKKLVENSFAKKSIWVLFLRIMGVGLLFGITLFITNVFDASFVGEYDLARSVLFILGSAALLGFNQAIIYYAGYLKAHKSSDQLWGIYLKMVGFSLGIAVLLCLICWMVPTYWIDYFFDKPIYPLIFKTTATAFFYSLTMLNIDTLRGLGIIIASEVFRNIFRHLFFGILVVSLYYYNAFQWLADMFLVSFLLLAFISTVYLLFRFRKEAKSSIPTFSLKTILKTAYPMSISAMAFFLLQSIDLLLIGKFMELKYVAFYAVALKIAMIISILLASVNAVFAPKISELYASKKVEELSLQIKKVTRMTVVFTAPLIVLVVLFSRTVLSFFGEGYTVAKTALLILLAGQTVNVLCGSMGTYMDMTGYQNVFQKILLLALGVNIALNWFMIPIYGLVGAAIATAVSTITWNILGTVYVYNKRGIKTFLH
ncbi:flippase [Flavobacteriaceae bacterium TK19130]|nr:flippase [Thermobacterium salinum]